LGLGGNHCRSSSIGGRVRTVLEAVRLGAENEIRQQSFSDAPLRRIGCLFLRRGQWPLPLGRERAAESGMSKEVELQSSRRRTDTQLLKNEAGSEVLLPF